MGLVSSKLRNSARGQQCAFAIPGICSHDRSTVVLCHLPSEVKAMATKSDDFNAAFGCSQCHEAIDNHRLSKEEELYFSLRALQKTQRIWVASGLIVVPEKQSVPKPLSKTMPRRHIATGERI
ncbi:nuclease domain-containing protein [Mesorhizobium sp. ESP-6-2]|uniref:nuclease domain-containing protein n=1 Tax=Mesorhizobium sp. ESP-6-2 TaxID=2876625 RepID=UPI001CCE57E4|nr:nuclease domain-containing protein [Mesorhizobium sp. ESP-6-2]MBZ9807646.1 DUF1364 domain-containing protein [Mesorhizobium sp. ESP-6-2]